MRREPPPIDRERVRRLAFVNALALLALAGGLLQIARLHRGAPLLLAGLVLGGVRFVAPDTTARLVAPVLLVLGRVGELVGTLLLTVAYALLVVPYAMVLRVLRVIESPSEPWPPTSESGWSPLDERAGVVRRGRGVSLAARLIVQVSDAALLVRFFASRPGWFLLPLVVFVLVLAGVVLFGNATGLGPLIYTLF